MPAEPPGPASTTAGIAGPCAAAGAGPNPAPGPGPNAVPGPGPGRNAAPGPGPERAPGQPHVLILGGTTEARRLAEALAAEDTAPSGAPYRVTTSLAGRVASPALPPGETRIGGFGGPAGLAAWITAHRVTHLVDATHPFAERMSFNAAGAAALSGVPLLALRRPGWIPGPGDDWHAADSLTEAAALLPGLGSRVFLTTGRMGLHSFAHLTEPWFLVRSVDPPDAPAPPRLEVLLARGPFTLDDERDLLARHRIDLLVTKDSGGSATAPKLTAAREAGIPVLVVRRPPIPEGVPQTGCVTEVRQWLSGPRSLPAGPPTG